MCANLGAIPYPFDPWPADLPQRYSLASDPAGTVCLGLLRETQAADLCKACGLAAGTTRPILRPAPLSVPAGSTVWLSPRSPWPPLHNSVCNSQTILYLPLTESGAVVDFMASCALVHCLTTTVDTGLLWKWTAKWPRQREQQQGGHWSEIQVL